MNLRLRPSLISMTAATAIMVGSPTASALNYVQGVVTEISFVEDTVIFRVSGGVPTTTCNGANGNWLRIPASYKSMIAFITGEWLKGNIPGVSVAAYGSGLDGSGFCAVTQIDPVE